MALETIRNGYRGEQITEEIATPRYRSWEFELRRKKRCGSIPITLPQRLPFLSALPILARRCPVARSSKSQGLQNGLRLHSDVAIGEYGMSKTYPFSVLQGSFQAGRVMT